jgi:hypothetical protein
MNVSGRFRLAIFVSLLLLETVALAGPAGSGYHLVKSVPKGRRRARASTSITSRSIPLVAGSTLLTAPKSKCSMPTISPRIAGMMSSQNGRAITSGLIEGKYRCERHVTFHLEKATANFHLHLSVAANLVRPKLKTIS